MEGQNVKIMQFSSTIQGQWRFKMTQNLTGKSGRAISGRGSGRLRRNPEFSGSYLWEFGVDSSWLKSRAARFSESVNSQIRNFLSPKIAKAKMSKISPKIAPRVCYSQHLPKDVHRKGPKNDGNNYFQTDTLFGAGRFLKKS